MISVTLSEKVGSLFLIGLEDCELNKESINVLKTIQPGFVILFQRNVKSPEQLYAFVKSVKEVLNNDVVFAIDQEGGIVTRLENGFAISPGAMAVSATGKTENAYITGKILGSEMRKMGISWDLAPVVDINDNYINPSLGVRSFGDTPQMVCDYSEEFHRGLKETKVAGSAKHFPGKGSVSVDPHLDMPYLDKSFEELKENELIPFENIFKKGIETVMISHLYLPQIAEEKTPASISENMMKGLLKKQLGYEGILVSDDLTMGGVSNECPVHEAAYKALMAGMDIIDICHKYENQLSAFEGLVKKAEENKDVREAIENAYEKVSKFIKEFAVPVEEMDMASVGLRENVEAMERISLDSITLFENNDNMLPLALDENDTVFHVKPLRQSLVEEEREGTYIISEMKKLFEKPDYVQFEARIKKDNADKLLMDKKGKTAVIFTENAYLFDGQKYLVEKICEKYAQVLLIALRNPYDARINGVKNSLLSYGYSLPSQKALLKVIKGERKANGVCPVKIPERV